MVACMSLDGFIADAGGSCAQEASGGWTSAEDKREFWQEVADCDVVVGGRRALDGMPATRRPVALLSRRPEEALAGPVNGEVQWVVDPYPSEVHDFLAKFRDKRVLLCGGSMAYDFFLRWNLVDDMVLVIEPVALGRGTRLRTPPQTAGGQDMTRFSLVKCRPLNLRGTVRLDLRRAKSW